jgi:hypothetical protein
MSGILKRIPNIVFILAAAVLAGVVATTYLNGSSILFRDGKVTFLAQAQVAEYSIAVPSIEQANQTTGKYFNFEPSLLDDAIGTSAWTTLILPTTNSRTRKSGVAIFWREANGGPESLGHGRFDSVEATPGDWQINDVAIVKVERSPIWSFP